MSHQTFACSNDCGRAAMPGHDLCMKCDEQVLGENIGCGHPASQVVTSREGTSYCPACEAGEERGFEGHGDFYSDDPVERWIAHQAAKGRL